MEILCLYRVLIVIVSESIRLYCMEGVMVMDVLKVVSKVRLVIFLDVQREEAAETKNELVYVSFGDLLVQLRRVKIVMNNNEVWRGDTMADVGTTISMHGQW